MQLTTSVIAALTHEEVQLACAEYMEKHGLTGATSQKNNVEIVSKRGTVTATLSYQATDSTQVLSHSATQTSKETSTEAGVTQEQSQQDSQKSPEKTSNVSDENSVKSENENDTTTNSSVDMAQVDSQLVEENEDNPPFEMDTSQVSEEPVVESPSQTTSLEEAKPATTKTSPLFSS